MTPDPTPTSDSRMRFSLRSILLLTVAVAAIFAVGIWLPDPFNWLAAAPLLSVVLAVFVLRGKGWQAIAAGSGLFFLVGLWLITWELGSPEFFAALFVFTAFGAGFGSGVGALALRRYGLGVALFVFVALSFLFALSVPVQTPPVMFETIGNGL